MSIVEGFTRPPDRPKTPAAFDTEAKLLAPRGGSLGPEPTRGVPVVPKDLGQLTDGLASIGLDLDELTKLYEHAAWQDPVAARARTFGKPFADTVADHPVPSYLRFVSEDTWARYMGGKAMPAYAELRRLLDSMSSPNESLPATERLKLEAAHRAASQIPWTLKQRLAGAAQTSSTAAAQLIATSEKVAHLQTSIIDLEAALAAAAAGSTEEQQLRDALRRANIDLQDALGQQHQDGTHLASCAVELSQAVTSYLAYVDQAEIPRRHSSAVRRVRARADASSGRKDRAPHRRVVAGRRRST